jgi:hypothetical protein
MFLNVASSSVIICGMPSSECGRQITEGIISFKSRCDRQCNQHGECGVIVELALKFHIISLNLEL